MDELRASDAERDAVVARLNAAVGEGRLTLEEFSERVEQVYLAKTRRELEPPVADLPPPPGTPQDDRPAAVEVSAEDADEPKTQWHVAPIGGMKQRGRWRMARRTVAISMIGGTSLDLGHAELAAHEVTLTKFSLLGGVNLRVPPGVRVEVSGFSLRGAHDVDREEQPEPGAPTVRVRAYSLLGGVTVRSSRPLERWRQALRARRR